MDTKTRASNKHQDINDLMLKCISDLSVQPKQEKPGQNKTKQFQMSKDRTNTIYNQTSSKRIEDFLWISKNDHLNLPVLFVNENKQENWAVFDENFNEIKQEITDSDQEKNQAMPIYDFKKNSSLFDVWHSFFSNLKTLYEKIYSAFIKQSEINSDVFHSNEIREYLNCVDETYLVFKRVLASSNKYVSKKQSHIDNNAKHEIDRLYQNVNKLLNRRSAQSSQHTILDLNSNQQELCNLCLHFVDIKELVQIDHFKYHISCINFWLNCVQNDTLPTLQLNSNKDFDI